MTLRLIIERHDLRRTRWEDSPARPLADGEVRLRIARVALTANNITYAAFGDAMHYWDFFPTGDAATGCLPVWGFGDVAESRHEAVQVGEQVARVPDLAGLERLVRDAQLQPEIG